MMSLFTPLPSMINSQRFVNDKKYARLRASEK